ncbi:sugar transferase [Alloacidobacterium dinghuense]|uniref:Sugar transferase n=1 Tax=Alloacidobacterium dinghuense TaxID=2763107 RepID=A0A7G8BLR1_9BACT|nr:sugar transferase [Alloacidobacterium dinghuense]QNI33481.1 sugar transferase [Alloacidobacterium dinghuense]
MTLLDSIDEGTARSLLSSSTDERIALCEDAFRRMLVIERKRTERSGKPFLLVLLEAGNNQDSGKNGKALESLMSALLSSTRETDVIGWYKHQTTVGAMFTGLLADEKNSILSILLTRISNALREILTFEQFSQVSISFHFYPDDWDQDGSGRPSNAALYPDLSSRDDAKRSLLGVKRAMDIVGSCLTLIICAPVLLFIGAAIKLSSNGPILFKQQRVGRHGQCFTFLKFRSMHVNNDHSAHKEYVTKLIAGEASRESMNGNGDGVYKLANDKRITPLGRLLRRSSLDELPQFLNVLRGDMSLVGPRPAIPYEVATYQTWHRRRVLDVKPGITGLWQVNGRNRLKFDEMVRLDLQYAKSWSPWLDLKILMLTPRAVLKGAC